MNEPKAGDVLAGKFRVERVLGIGGMGMVVSAMHVHLDEQVAIKFLLPEALLNAEAVARFGREARAAAKIKSEHVARVIDVGALESGAPFMVMELLRGQDLSSLLRERGALPIAHAVAYVLQACEALAEAHAIGIVHRDLKPANLFLTARADGSSCIKVLDFGISKLTSSSGSGASMALTRTQAILGSPLYMSPEQLASAKDVDQRTDIWAIGAVLYQLLTGRVPFEAETLPQLCTLIVQTEPLPPRRIRPDIPERLEQAVLRCLRKARGERYPNVAALAVELAVFSPELGPRSAERISRVLSASGSASTELAASQLPLPPSAASTGSGQAWSGTTQLAGKSRAIWVGLGATAALALTIGLGWKALGTTPIKPDAPSAGTPTPMPPPAAPAATGSAPGAAPSVSHMPAATPPPLEAKAAPAASSPATKTPVVAKRTPAPRPSIEAHELEPRDDVDPLSERR